MKRSTIPVALLAASLFGIVILGALAVEEPAATPIPDLPRSAPGPLIVIDIGHGGRDPGATYRLADGSVLSEHAIAYDIGARLFSALQSQHTVRVRSIIQFPQRPRPDNRRVPQSESAAILETEPPCDLSQVETRTAVNLRWMLSNTIANREYMESGNRAVTMFLSLHVDARASNELDGVALYLPPQSLGTSAVSAGPEYSRYEQARLYFAGLMPTRPGQDSRATSTALAELMRDDLEKAGVRMCDLPGTPRDEHSSNYPAVLNYNQIPARLLIEVGSLTSPVDRDHLTEPAYRQKIAEALADAVGRFGRESMRSY
jgi:N-acetylmuramoyl-L-alanine amidase